MEKEVNYDPSGYYWWKEELYTVKVYNSGEVQVRGPYYWTPDGLPHYRGLSLREGKLMVNHMDPEEVNYLLRIILSFLEGGRLRVNNAAAIGGAIRRILVPRRRPLGEELILSALETLRGWGGGRALALARDVFPYWGKAQAVRTILTALEVASGEYEKLSLEARQALSLVYREAVEAELPVPEGVREKARRWRVLPSPVEVGYGA